METEEKPEAIVEKEFIAPPSSEGMLETEPGKAGRVKAFWTAKFPDKSYENDEEFDGAMADYLEESDERMAKHATAEETFRRVAAEHPELLDVVEDLSGDKDMSLMEALYRNVDPEEFMPEEGDPDFERMRTARKDRMDRTAEAETFRRKLEENLEESTATIEKYFTDNEVLPEEQKAIAEYIDNIMDQYTNRLITPEVLDAFRRAHNYKKDVKQAREVGEIQARNTKIDAERQRKAEETDGLPTPGSSAGAVSMPTQKRKVIDVGRVLGLSEEELQSRRDGMKKQ